MEQNTIDIIAKVESIEHSKKVLDSTRWHRTYTSLASAGSGLYMATHGVTVMVNEIAKYNSSGPPGMVTFLETVVGAAMIANSIIQGAGAIHANRKADELEDMIMELKQTPEYKAAVKKNDSAPQRI